MQKERFSAIINSLEKGLFERKEILSLSLLAALSGESVFMIGPPGVGKSLIARRLKYAFKDSQSFEYLMTRFSTPEEVFGPVSIQKLKNDKYERNTEQYLPSAQFVFLDEIWKAGSAIQNALLTVLNERIYRNGGEIIQTDIRCIIAASNEIPQDSDVLGPLYDRFLLRYVLNPIKSPKLFAKLLNQNTSLEGDPIPAELKISQEEWKKWQEDVLEVKIPESVAYIVHIIREKIEEYNQRTKEEHLRIFISDRRWKKIMNLLRAAAYVHERKEVQLADCFLMTHCLWNHPDQKTELENILKESIRDHGYSLNLKLPALRREVELFSQDVESETRLKIKESKEVLRIVEHEYHIIKKNNDRFKAERVKVKDLRNLQRNEAQVINYYDSVNKLVNRVESILGEQAFSIEVTVNGQKEILRLETHREEHIRIVSKKPHKLLNAYWEEWGNKIEQFLREKEQALLESTPAELNDLPEHLLLGKETARLIRHNLESVQSELSDLRFELEKSQHLFRSPEHDVVAV
jgi:MoxR-like ATPase